jgi:hypothetical protein
VKSLFGDQIPDVAPKPKKDRAHPAPVGSGLEGETCRTCRHYRQVQYHDYVHHKCGLVEWTHGRGTDIRAKDQACRRWQKVED